MEISLGRGHDAPVAFQNCLGIGCREDLCWSSQPSGEAQHCCKAVPDGSQSTGMSTSLPRGEIPDGVTMA